MSPSVAPTRVATGSVLRARALNLLKPGATSSLSQKGAQASTGRPSTRTPVGRRVHGSTVITAPREKRVTRWSAASVSSRITAISALPSAIRRSRSRAVVNCSMPTAPQYGDNGPGATPQLGDPTTNAGGRHHQEAGFTAQASLRMVALPIDDV